MKEPDPALAATAPPESGAPAAPSAQRRVGGFRIDSELGRGAMGVVLQGYDATLDRKVAIKLIHPQHASSPDATARLLREARAMARMAHPNVVRVYAADSEGSDVYIAMEFVDGETLRGWLAREPRDWRAVMGVFIAAGHGLAAAHQAGHVHRDFKPDNVLVERASGRVLVSDFGLATPAGQAAGGGAPRAELEPQLTQTGAVLGTPLYMAPEQHRGERTGAAADQFAFCVALYEALYRCRPFAGQSYAELCANVVAGQVLPPPPESRVPRHLRDILLRGMSSDPAARFPDMHALLAALLHDPEAPRRRTRRNLLIGAAVLLAAGIVAAGIYLATSSQQRRVERSEQREREATLSALRRTGSLLASTLAMQSALPLAQSDFSYLPELVASAERDQAAVRALAILEPDGRVIAAGKSSPYRPGARIAQPSWMKAEEHWKQRGERGAIEALNLHDGGWLFVTPIQLETRQLGWVWLEISLRDYELTLDRQLRER